MLDWSQEQMASFVGVSPRSWQNYEGAKTVPDGLVYAKLCALGFRGRWLLGGEPPIYDDRRDVNGALVSTDDDLVALPRYDVAAAAGVGSLVGTEQLVGAIYFRRDWLRDHIGVSPGRLAVITASGDSMAPTIESGDLLVVDVGEQKWKSDGVYVIGVDDELSVKRVAKDLAGAFVVSSDNPMYAHTTQAIERADLRSLRLIGRVVWVGGRI